MLRSYDVSLILTVSIISGPCNCGHILLCSTVFGLPSDFTDGGNTLYKFILEVIIAVSFDVIFPFVHGIAQSCFQVAFNP